jgi:large subunit ribosomal protein L28
MDKKLFLTEENRWVKLRVSAAGLRFINKTGLKKALEEAKTKGYIKNY